MNDVSKFTLFTLFSALFLSYSVFLYCNQPKRVDSNFAQADHGKMVWQQYNCNACHQIYGQGGFLGPDLTNSYSKRGEKYIDAYMQSGTNIMPNFHLSDEERNALILYLKSVDQSGSADPKTFTIYANGSIEQ